MKLVTPSMPEARDIRIWQNFREVTDLTFIAVLHEWPCVPTWSLLSMYVRDEAGSLKTEMVDGEIQLQVRHRQGLTWWRRRRER